MNEMRRGRLLRRVLALTGAAALAAGGIMAAGGVALADTGDDTPTTAEIGNINPTAPKSLTVHKFPEVGNPYPYSPDGSDAPPGGMNGVEFTIRKVNGLDLSDPAAWDIAQELVFVPADPGVPGSVDHATANGVDYTLGAGITQQTAGGHTVFTGLEFAVYLVTEGADLGENGITNKAAPFFVTLPLPDNGQWIYQVHVYPKNSVSTVTKAVTGPETYGLGSEVTWPITIAIPTLSPGVSFTSFSVTDDLDDRLEYVSHTIEIDGLPVSGASVATPAAGTSGGTFSATLAGPGISITPSLASSQGKELVVEIVTRVVSLEPTGEGGASGEIANFANVKINDFDTDTNLVYTYWGDLWVQKTDNFKNVLEDAVFEIFACAPAVDGEPDATIGSRIGVLTGDDANDPSDWTYQFESDATGKVFIQGLWVSNDDEVQTRDYCLKEVAAPAGYNLMSPNPKRVTVHVGSSSEADVTVANPQKPPVDLPLTGSTGTAVFMAGGIALLLTACGIALLSSRRRAREHAEL